MRPSSGGSSRMSNWFDPACAREAIATARPEIGTAASVVGVPEVVADVAFAEAAADTKPKLGSPAASVLVPVALPLFDEAVAAPVAEAVEGSDERMPKRSVVAAAGASVSAAVPALSATAEIWVCCADVALLVLCDSTLLSPRLDPTLAESGAAVVVGSSSAVSVAAGADCSPLIAVAVDFARPLVASPIAAERTFAPAEAGAGSLVLTTSAAAIGWGVAAEEVVAEVVDVVPLS